MHAPRADGEVRTRTPRLGPEPGQAPLCTIPVVPFPVASHAAGLVAQPAPGVVSVVMFPVND
jgi:hypothetical protein